MLPEKSFDTGEVVINYVESAASGSPLLMLHGLTGAMIQEPFSVPLALKWRVLACDFRGHGKSGKVAGQYHILDYKRDIIAFLRGNFTEPAVLLGHSLGAMTAIAVAAEEPGLVRALVLLDPPLFLRNSPLAAKVSAHTGFSAVYEVLKDSPSYEFVLGVCQAAFPNDGEAANRLRADQYFSLDPGTVGVFVQNQVFTGWDLELALQHITCPTLLMRGDWDHDALVRDEDAADMKNHLPQVVDIKLPNGTHVFPFELPDLTLTHVQTFLQSL